MKRHIIRGKWATSMYKVTTVQCSTVHLRWQKRWPQLAEALALLVNTRIWKVHAKSHSAYSTAASWNLWMCWLHKMWLGSISARFSVSGKQNVRHV